MKKLTTILLAGLLISCTTRAGIPPIGHEPISSVKPPLQLWGISPTSGRPYGGYRVYVYGLGFEHGYQVYIGDKICAEPSVNDAGTRISCTVPDGEQGQDYLVSVMDSEGISVPFEKECDMGDADCEATHVCFYYVYTAQDRADAMKKRRGEKE